MLRTKKQEKNICQNCPIAKAANLLGDSIILIIINELKNDSKRFSELELALIGVSTKTLTEKLNLLQDKDLITRERFCEKPPRVEYSLTEKGKGLKKILNSLLNYGEKYL